MLCVSALLGRAAVDVERVNKREGCTDGATHSMAAVARTQLLTPQAFLGEQ